MCKRVFKEETLKIDLWFRKSTDMKPSRRVIFPLGRPVKEEAKIETRIGIWKEVIQRYIRDKCKEGGKQEVNLDKSQSIGRMKVNKRVKNREIHVSPSDKGKGVVVMSLDSTLSWWRPILARTKKLSGMIWRRHRRSSGATAGALPGCSSWKERRSKEHKQMLP